MNKTEISPFPCIQHYVFLTLSVPLILFISPSHSLPLRQIMQAPDQNLRFLSTELNSENEAKNGEMKQSMAIVFRVTVVV